MANEVKILITAVDKASATLNKVQSELKQTGQTGQTSFLGMGKSALAAVGGIAAVGAAVGAAANFVKGSIDDWANYNEEIRKMSIATNAAPEDLSRMMQAADDLGVSMDGLYTSLRILSRQGVQPTIENVAQLSDQLLAVSDPTERAAQMAKLFGRNWSEVAPFVLAGGDAIRAGTAAIDDSLVSTQKSIDQSRAYKAAVDNLADAWGGLKNTIGNEAMPVLTSALVSLDKNLQYAIDDAAAIEELNRLYKINILTRQEQIDLGRQYQNSEITLAELQGVLTNRVREYNDALAETGPDMNELINQTNQHAEAAKYSAASTWEQTDAFAAMTQGASDAAAATQRATRKLEELSFIENQMKDIDIGARLTFNIPDLSGQIENYFDVSAWEEAGGAALEAALGNVDQLLKDNKITKGQADAMFGELYIAAQNIQVELGNITADEAASNISNTLGMSLKDALATLNEIRRKASFNVDSYVNIYYNEVMKPGQGGSGPGRGNNNPALRDTGGPVEAGTPYLIGVNRKPEIFVPETSGQIYPIGSGASMSAFQGGGNIYNSVTIIQQPGQSSAGIVDALLYQLNRRQSSRAAGIKYAGR